jgi:hypothetical protein
MRGRRKDKLREAVPHGAGRWTVPGLVIDA